jgi:hypothetical protein
MPRQLMCNSEPYAPGYLLSPLRGFATGRSRRLSEHSYTFSPAVGNSNFSAVFIISSQVTSAFL